jgi:uncharacterized membrane protein YphA (DoxX/SURF4 family)
LTYELVQGRTAIALAKGLPWIEIICGGLLLFGLLTPGVALASFVLLWVFTAAIVSTFLRDKSVGCGCFGRRTDAQTSRARWTVAYRNLCLMGLLTIIYNSGGYSLFIDALVNDSSGLVSAIPLLQQWLVLAWTISMVATVSLHLLVWRRLAGSGHRRNQAPGT